MAYLLSERFIDSEMLFIVYDYLIEDKEQEFNFNKFPFRDELEMWVHNKSLFDLIENIHEYDKILSYNAYHQNGNRDELTEGWNGFHFNNPNIDIDENHKHLREMIEVKDVIEYINNKFDYIVNNPSDFEKVKIAYNKEVLKRDIGNKSLYEVVISTLQAVENFNNNLH